MSAQLLRLVWRLIGASLGLGVSMVALGATYSFPGSMPSGCSGSAGSYTCGAVTLSAGDVVTIGVTPTTISFTSLSTNNAQINASGSASGLTLNVSGTLSASAGAVIKANINAVRVSSSGAVNYGGSITTTTDYISLGAGTQVAGALTTTTGPITLLTGTAGTYTQVGSINSGGTVTLNSYNSVGGDVVGYLVSASGNNTFGGSITATSTYVSLGGNASVVGSIYAETHVDTGSNSQVGGSITSATSYIDTGTASTIGGSLAALGTYVDIHGSATVNGSIKAKSYVHMTTNSAVAGNITADSTVHMGTGSTVGKCVRSNGASSISVPSATAVGGACCGSGSTCTNTCVSGTPKPAACSWPSSGLVAEYRFEETSYSGQYGEVIDSSGNKWNGRVVGSASSTSSGKFCRGLQIPKNLTASIDALDTGIDVAAIGNAGSASFWYKSVASGNEHRMLMDATELSSGKFYLYRDDDETGVDLNFHVTDGGGTVRNVDKLNTLSDGEWGHVVLTWKFITGSSATRLRLYVNGALQDEKTYTVASGVMASTIKTLYFGDNRSAASVEVNSANGYYDQIELYEGELTASDVSSLYAKSPTCTPAGVHHYEVTSDASSALTCSPVTFTVKACADASCGTPYTSGAVSATLSVSGTDVTPYSGAVSTSTGQATLSTTLGISNSAANSATATVSLTAYSPTPSNPVPVYYGMNTTAISGGGQTIALSNTGFLFDVKHHVAETQQTVTVSAVKKSDNSSACTSAFGNADKVLNFKCSYTNPGSGTRAVRIADSTYGVWSALNAANSATAACDGTGADVTLRFNASGVATMNLKYADVGNLGLAATHTSGSLSMAGTDSFIASPWDFAVAVTTSGNITAGSAFAGTVTARNYAQGTTPNFGRESTAEGVTLSFARTSPRFTGSVTGSFSGAVGAFSSGVASSSNLNYSQVGKGNVAAVLSSGNYLSSSRSAAGSTQSSAGIGSWVDCAAENATCALPTGATATMAFGANGLFNYQNAKSGNVTCSNAVFGDPIVGASKRCYYVVTGGTNTAATGSAGPFIPHHFTVGTTNACGSFTYSGQPAQVVVKAFNALDSTTPVVNYDGSDGTAAYNHARAVTLSDVGGASASGWGGTNAVASSAFASGVATLNTPTYTFANKLTAETTLTVRAVDTDGVSSQNYSEGALKLRSGRLKFSNAFGSEKVSLSVPVQAQYWSGKAWVANSADNCTSVPAASVAMSNHLTAKGTAATGSSAWGSTASAVTIASGNGTLVLSAPNWTSGGSGSVVGSVDVAFNLGSSSTDNACMGTHPTSTQAGLSWLRSLNGNCAATYDRDPSARISFGVFSPETKKVVHVRDLF
jgi:MSHA biogenesis protein MshQ